MSLTTTLLTYATQSWVASNLIYCAPIYNPSFTGIPKIGTKIIATTDQIPSLTGYAPLANPAFTGSATVGGNTVATTDQLPDMNLYARLAGPNFSGTPTVLSKPISTQNTSCYPAWYSVGR